MGGNVNIDWSGLASLNRDLVVRIRIPKRDWKELERIRDVLMAEEVGEDGDYVIVDVIAVKVRKNRMVVNMLGQMLALAMLAETVEGL